MVFVGFKNAKGIFHDQNKRAKRAIVSHKAFLWGYEGFGESYFKIPPYSLMSFKNLVF
ncbi:hypothetical protein HpCS12_05100 [Helicobacter pylori]